MKLTLFLILTALVSYGLGGLNGAIIASKNLFKRDVRRYGSGNAGLTNFTRVFGFNGAILVVVVDVLKTVLAVLFGRWLLGFEGYPSVGALFAGFCCMLGHVYPAYYRFHGGKAVLCGGTLVWMIDWRIGLICWSLFLILVIFTKYVSLGSIAAGAIFAPAVWAFGYPKLDIILGLLCGALLVFAHRENLVRLIKGTESKLSIGGGGTGGPSAPGGPGGTGGPGKPGNGAQRRTR